VISSPVAFDPRRFPPRRPLKPMQILASLTTSPAARWKETDRRGRVAKGLAADLVVLDADPAEGAANFATVRCTIRGGRLIHHPQDPAP